MTTSTAHRSFGDWARAGIGGVYAAFRVWTHWWDPQNGGASSRGLIAALGALNVLTLLDAVGLFDFVSFVAMKDSPQLWLLIMFVGIGIALTLEFRPVAKCLDQCGRGLSGKELWTHVIAAGYVALTAGAVYVVALARA